jgi:hypothetical protein
MATALDIAGLAAPPRQGVAARFARRFGGAVRTVVASGVALAGSLRRPAMPNATHDARAAGDLTAPIPPGTPRTPRRPRPAAPVSLPEAARSGLLLRLVDRKHRRTARRGRRRYPDDYTPFTPEDCPELTPEMCHFLNTPIGDSDPAMVRALFTALEEYLVALLSSKPGFPGAETVHAVIRARLGGLLDAPGPDAPPTEAPDPALAIISGDAVPATAMDAAPDAPADATPDAPAPAASTAVTDEAFVASTDDLAPVAGTDAPPHANPATPINSQPDAPLVSAPTLPEAFLALFAAAWRGAKPVSPDPLREAPAATLAESVPIAAIATAETTPATGVPRQQGFHRSQSFLFGRTFLLRHGRSLAHCYRLLFDCWRRAFSVGSRDERRCLLSPPLLC